MIRTDNDTYRDWEKCVRNVFVGMVTALAMLIALASHGYAADTAIENTGQVTDRDLRAYAAYLRQTLERDGSMGVERQVKECYRLALDKIDLAKTCLVLDQAAKRIEDAYLRSMAERFGKAPDDNTMWRRDRYEKRMAEWSTKAFGSQDAAQAYLGNAGQLVFLLYAGLIE
jgi:hypothetical protein